MKIRLVTSPTTYEAAINTIKQIDVTKKDEYNLLVVPDAFSMQAENLLFDVLKLKSVFNVEVVGISKLASYFLKSQNVQYERVGGLEEVFNVYKATKACERDFKYFGKCDVDFCNKILQVIKQFKGSKVRPEHIKSVSDTVLDRKIHDIKIIYEKYEELLGEKLDLSKMLEFAVKNANYSENVSHINLFFANFDSFSLEINDFICKLAKIVGSVCIGMSKAASSNNEYIFEDDIIKKTTVLARENSILVETVHYPTLLDERRKKISENLFGFKVEEGKVDNYFLNVLANNKEQEVEFVAKYIKKATYLGANYKSFAVAVSDDSYFDKIENVFKRYNITYYSDKATSLSDTIICRFLLKMLEFAKLGLNKERFKFLVNSPLIEVEGREEILRDIEYFNVQTKEEFLERFPQFESLVLKIDQLSMCQTISQYLRVLKTVLELCQSGFFALLKKITEHVLFKEESQNSQAMTLTFQLIEKLEVLGGDEKIEIQDFESLFMLALESVKVETIPSFIDAVYVADASKSYFEDVHTLFVLGATANALPQTKNDTAIIDDSDIEKLRLQFLLEPQIKVLNRRSRLKLFECLLHAKERLVVCLPTVEEGRISTASDFVKDLKKLFGENVLHLDSLEDIKTAGASQQEVLENLKFFIGTKENLSSAIALLKSKNKLPLHLEGAVDSIADNQIFKQNKQNLLSDATKDVLLRRNHLSASALETYFSCPFKHFVAYGLKLKQKENIEPNPRTFGVFEHAILEKFVKDNKTLGSLTLKDVDEYLDKNVLEIAKEVYDKKILKRKSFLSYLKNESRIILQNVVYEQKYSKYKPLLLEEKIVDAFDEGEKLVGFVDRVDTFENYFRIIDYKTGKTQAIKKDLFYGKKMQLFLYADAMQKKLAMLCGGLYYFDCRTKYSKTGKVNKLNGITLAEDKTVSATDKRLEDENFKSDIAGFAVKKSAQQGELSYKGGSAVCDLEKLFSYARNVSKKALNELREGYILDKPFLGECDRCPYLSVCLHRESDGYRIMQSVRDEDLKG